MTIKLDPINQFQINELQNLGLQFDQSLLNILENPYYAGLLTHLHLHIEQLKEWVSKNHQSIESGYRNQELLVSTRIKLGKSGVSELFLSLHVGDRQKTHGLMINFSQIPCLVNLEQPEIKITGHPKYTTINQIENDTLSEEPIDELMEGMFNITDQGEALWNLSNINNLLEKIANIDLLL